MASSSSNALSEIIKGFSSIGFDVNVTLRETMRKIFIDRCLTPIAKILEIVPIIEVKIQERKNLLLDVGFYNSKRQSERNSGKDDNHPNLIKIINKLSEAERQLKNLTDDIENCIDQLCVARPFMLGPEIAALIACMETFPLIISQKVGQITPLIPQTASTKCLLLASIETDEKDLKSNGIIETLKRNSTFPIEPVLRRTGAMGGTAGGYGHAGFLEELMSSVDLLKSNVPNLRNAGNPDTNDINRESMNTSRDSQSTRISSSSTTSADSSQFRSSSPSPNINNRPIATTKRPVIKLGDRPISTKNMQIVDTPPPSSSPLLLSSSSLPIATTSGNNTTSNEPSHVTRPLSMAKPSYPPPKPPKNNDIDNGENSSRRTPSKRLTGSAVLMSGRPRDLLGISTTSSSPSPSTLNQSESFDSISENDEEYDRWQKNNGNLYFLFLCLKIF